MGAIVLHPEVFDRCESTKEGALEGMVGMAELLGGLGFQKTR